MEGGNYAWMVKLNNYPHIHGVNQTTPMRLFWLNEFQLC